MVDLQVLEQNAGLLAIVDTLIPSWEGRRGGLTTDTSDRPALGETPVCYLG